MEWLSSSPPALRFPNTCSIHTHTSVPNTHTKLCWRHRYTNVFSSVWFFWTDQCCSPAAKPTDMLVYFSHAHFKFQHFALTEKPCVCLAQEDKKGRKISTSHHLHQNKNKQAQEKGAAKEVQGFFLHQKSFSCGFRQPASQI